VDDLREIAQDKDRHIIVAAGGESKRDAVRPLLRNPCYTALITDLTVAEDAIRDHGYENEGVAVRDEEPLEVPVK
jgi:DNA-binding transcriptional regulator LsrR (DeoR family)